MDRNVNNALVNVTPIKEVAFNYGDCPLKLVEITLRRATKIIYAGKIFN